jgi:hypothetical protein
MIQPLQGADISKDYTGTVRKKENHDCTALKKDRGQDPYSYCKEDLEKGEYRHC